MGEEGITIAWIVGAYLLGSIPFGVLAGRLRGVDVRGSGSGNIGATNVARTIGKKIGAVVLLFDAAKGYVPLALLVHAGFLPAPSSSSLVAIAVAPVFGHCFSPWLRFRGGKGVATTLGVLLASDPLLAGAICIFFAIIYAVARVVSVASLACAGLLPIAFWLRTDRGELLLMSAILAAVIVIQHRGNIRRILASNELKV